MNKQQRLDIWLKYDGHCAYCGKVIEYKAMQVDHIFPNHMNHYLKSTTMKRLAGVDIDSIDHFDNINPSCRQCNHYKRALTLEEFRTRIKTLHERIIKQYICKVAVDFGIIQIQEWDGKFYYEAKNTGKEAE